MCHAFLLGLLRSPRIGLGLRIRGAGFARAAAALLASEAARRDPALQAAPQRLRPEAIVEALAPYRVVIVPRIQTRLRAVPSDEEIGVAGEGPSSAWFILPASTIFLASPFVRCFSVLHT